MDIFCDISLSSEFIYTHTNGSVCDTRIIKYLILYYYNMGFDHIKWINLGPPKSKQLLKLIRRVSEATKCNLRIKVFLGRRDIFTKIILITTSFNVQMFKRWLGDKQTLEIIIIMRFTRTECGAASARENTELDDYQSFWYVLKQGVDWLNNG